MPNLSGLLAAIDPVWIIEPSRGRAALQTLETIDLAQHLAEYEAPPHPRLYWDDDEDDWDDVRDDRPYQVDGNGVARIDLIGIMTKRPQSWGRGTSTVLLRRTLRQAARDADVKGILLVIDSPGGQADGTADLASDIRLISQEIPVLGYIEDCGCSAAFWAASQCGAGLYCGRDATVGSVGAITEIVDTAEMYKKAGVKVYVIASGDLKAAFGSDGVPVTDTNLKTCGDYVVARAATFQADVKAARGLTPTRMEEIARAGVYVGDAARKMKLVDGISTLEEAYQMLAKALPKGGSEQLPPPDADDETAVRDDYIEDNDDDLDEQLRTGLGAGPPAVAHGAGVRAHLPTTSPGNAGEPTQPAASPAKPREKQMKEKFIRLLSAFGLNKLAMAVFQEKEDDPEAVVAAMAGAVNEQVDAKVKEHPLVCGLETAGVKDVDGLKALLKMAQFGEQALSELRAEAKAEAIRLYGPENGPKIGAQVFASAPAEARALRDAWRTEADAKFGHAESGAAPSRITAAAPVRESAIATGQPEEKKAPRERLSPTQLAAAGRMGYKTDAELDKFAENVLKEQAVLQGAAA